MLNKEKYAKEIIDIACNGESLGKYRGNLCPCCTIDCSDCDFSFNSDCSNCNERILEWANSEYKEREIDWNKVPVDTPIYVWDNDEDKIIYKVKRHFAQYDTNNDKITAFADGQTSWSSEQAVMVWDNAEIKEGIDCSQWYKD